MHSLKNITHFIITKTTFSDHYKYKIINWVPIYSCTVLWPAKVVIKHQTHVTKVRLYNIFMQVKSAQYIYVLYIILTSNFVLLSTLVLCKWETFFSLLYNHFVDFNIILFFPLMNSFTHLMSWISCQWPQTTI